MFNPERLLGGLIRSGMRRNSGMGSLLSSGAALGLVGVAMEAVEHFMNRPQTGSVPAGTPPVPPGAPPAMGAKMPPPPGSVLPVSAPPPPPPGGGGGRPSAGADASVQTSSEAVLLIRAMIAAANADGVIDAHERKQILNKLKSGAFSEEDHQFIVHELLSPVSMDAIVAEVTTGDTARQVYLVSLLAIEVDTDDERRYLQALAGRLGLEPAQVEEIHGQVGVPMF
jgi:hypothetical protein